MALKNKNKHQQRNILTPISCTTGKYDPGQGDAPGCSRECGVHGRVKVAENMVAAVRERDIDHGDTDTETHCPQTQVHHLKPNRQEIIITETLVCIKHHEQ